MKNIALQQGARYYVRYRVPGIHRTDQEFIGTFMSTHIMLDRNELMWSLRPLAGTSTVYDDHIKDIQPTSAPVMLPRRAR